MRVLLIGYGKMGRMIEQVCLRRGHQIAGIVDDSTMLAAMGKGLLNTTIENSSTADISIEFTRPEAAEANIRKCIEQGLSVVSGTTGWDITRLRKYYSDLCLSTNTHTLPAVMWSSNYSVGVNVFLAAARLIAGKMKDRDYTTHITEIHHIHKLDAPSGTAKILREVIANAGDIKEAEIPIRSLREGEIPGIHEVVWDSAVDSLRLEHNAKSREGFALGAVLAAEWLYGKTGWHSVEEMY